MLNKRICTKCTKSLEKSENRVSLTESNVGVKCKCGRKYIFNIKTNSYRFATEEEMRLIDEKSS